MSVTNNCNPFVISVSLTVLLDCHLLFFQFSLPLLHWNAHSFGPTTSLLPCTFLMRSLKSYPCTYGCIFLLYSTCLVKLQFWLNPASTSALGLIQLNLNGGNISMCTSLTLNLRLQPSKWDLIVWKSYTLLPSFLHFLTAASHLDVLFPLPLSPCSSS